MFFYLSGFSFLCCLVLGGGTRNGVVSDAVLQLLSVPLLLVSTWRIWDGPLTREMHRVLAFCGAIFALLLIQLIPLPPALWTHLPGREIVVAAFEFTGRSPSWSSISMAPESTWLSAISLLPPLAVFLAVVTLDWRERRQLSLLVIAFSVASAFLGLMQLAEGPTSPLRFFEITNQSSPVGFFANVNHFAALLYCAILLAAAWVATRVGAMRPGERIGRNGLDKALVLKTIAASFALLVLIVAEIMTRSRAGSILALVALFSALALTSEAPAPRNARNLAFTAVIIGVVLLALVLLGGSPLSAVLSRFDVDPMTDARIVVARVTVVGAKSLMPVGAGVGAFVSAYPMFERPQDLLPGLYANHAHNDFLELWLETGVAGPLLSGLFLYWLVRRAARAWKPSNPGPIEIDRALIRAAILIIALLLSHSLVDYPLRTGAMMAVMAFACALLVDPASPASALEAVSPPIDARRARHRSRSQRIGGDRDDARGRHNRPI